MIFNVGAGNGGSVVYLTQAEYDALPDSKLSNNIEYRITDGDMGVATASNLSYDNSFSGLEAVTVQQAVDEVNNSLDCGITNAQSINADSGVNFSITFNTEFKKVPIVVASVVESGSYGVPIIRILSVTKTGCTVRVYNDMTQKINSLQVSWIAISK